LWVGSEKLDRQRHFEGGLLAGKLPGGRHVPAQALHADHFRGDHSSPVIRRDPAERRIRHAGHGRKNQGRIDPNRSDVQWSRAPVV
jgi:hypothetical protein